MAEHRWTLSAEAVELALKEPFRISRRSWDVARNVFVTVTCDGLTGVGESSPDGSCEDVITDLESLDLGSLSGPFDLEGASGLLPPGPARAALDIALHDLAAQRAGVSVTELLGLSGRPIPPTSVTVAIDDPERMVERVRARLDDPVLKLKVGFDGDVELVERVRAVHPGRIRIDANEGWDEPTAKERLGSLENVGVELCEQPVPSDNLESLKRVSQATSIPVFADEDVSTAADVATLAGVVDGVNLKLRKAGGIREVVKAAAVARAHGMSVMIGCDLTSGVAATAEAHIGALADFVDIDGPLLLASDPWPGVRYDRGMLVLPTGTGLGVVRSQ